MNACRRRTVDLRGRTVGPAPLHFHAGLHYTAGMSKMTPTEAVNYLRDQKWSEERIGQAVAAHQSTIHRIGKGQEPAFTLGKAIVELAEAQKTLSDVEARANT